MGQSLSNWYRYSPLISLIAVVAVITALSAFYRWLVFESIVEAETRSNVALTKAFANSIWPNFSASAQAGTASRAEAERVDAALRKLAHGLDVVKVKIYAVDGTTLYSTDRRQIGENKRDNPGFRSAAAGIPASDITYRHRIDAWEGELSDRNIIATYVPVQASETAPVEAVMEVYADVSDLVWKMGRTQWLITAGVIGAMTLLYLVMLTVTRRSERLVQEQDAQRRANEELIRYQALHDPLTDLPNRASFGEHLSAMIKRSKRAGWSFAVMFLDLDRFKLVNDSLGHDSGDELLRIVARRIQLCTRDSDMLFRMGGDEFTVLLENVRGPEESAYVADRIIEALAEPIELAGQEITTSVSIGIAIFPRDDQIGERLLKSADTAMYRAKELGRNRYAFFAPEMNERVESQLRIEAELRRAVKQGEFTLHYQPRVCAATQRVVGVEALLRWRHPERGLVEPPSFIPLLEESGLIVPVGAWVLRAACAQSKAWQNAGLAPLRVSVNISSRQFRSDSLVSAVEEALTHSGLAPELLEIELTESLLVDNTAVAVSIMQRLKDVGIAISIDDFGAGYSSLNYLKRLPIDRLKIDGSFIRDIGVSVKDTAIVEAIAALARSLEIDYVAEGVETAEQAAFLRGQRCAEVQGFHYSGPLPAASIPAVVERFAQRAALAA